MGGIKNIIQGHVNELLGNENALAVPRREVCRKCPLYHINDFWGWAECNSHLFMNQATGETSKDPVPGYVKGCGCRIEAKIRVAGEHCPAGKW